MNVLFLPPHYSDEFRGGDRWPHYMARALRERGLAVHNAAAIRSRRRAYYRLKQAAYRRLLRQGIDPAREPAAARHDARSLEGQLAGRDIDVVLGSDSIRTAFLDCPQPIVLWLDATFDALVDFYPGHMDLSAETVRNGHELEREALRRASLVIYSSSWAADNAIASYGVEPERVTVVPWGANLPAVPSRTNVEALVRARPLDVCRLLFLGADWERKGGPFAVEVARELDRAGIRSQLTVIGCRPNIARSARELVRVLGFLDKDSPKERALLEHELASAHLLILPTLADCTPLAINEAAAFGVPSLASRVGGIAETLRDGANGRTFTLTASPGDYRDYIGGLLRDGERYRRLALSSRTEYEARLNWATSAAEVERLLRLVLR